MVPQNRNNRFHVQIIWVCLLREVTAAMAQEGIQRLPKMCSQPGKGPKCEIKSNLRKLVCRKDYRSPYRREYREARILILCSWSEWYVNPEEIVSMFPLVQKLVIRNGNISEFLTDFPASESLESIVVRNLPLEDLRPNLFSSLRNLRLLDLRNNRLKHLDPEAIRGLASASKVHLTDNPWDCTTDLKWVLKAWATEKLLNVDKMVCNDSVYPGKPVSSVMFLIQGMESGCPYDICSCSMLNIVWDTDKRYLVPVITVNCSGQSLFDFPEKLPKNTTTLILRQNNITDLLSLVKDNTYSNIADIYLDENDIGNIDVLEGALWLTKFRVFSLRGNRLNQLPTYALDNAFEKNRNIAEIYLGNNPWKCDCMFTSDFQHLLIKYRSVVKDMNDIRCSNKIGGDNAPIPVLDISIGSVCASSTNEINPLDILSAVLGFLILLVLGKLLYDYWTFKRTGKLPWIVAKMP